MAYLCESGVILSVLKYLNYDAVSVSVRRCRKTEPLVRFVR